MQRFLKSLLIGQMDVNEKGMNCATSPCSDVDTDGCRPTTNGLLLSNNLIPEEVIATILNFLSWRELLPCRLVCRAWSNIVDSYVRLEKIKTIDISSVTSSDNGKDYSSLLSFGHLPFHIVYNIQAKFGKNLLKNPFGVDKMDSWEVKRSGGDGWIVEEVPVGSPPLPETLEGRPCFVTSYRWGFKQQLIDLKSLGFDSKLMDEIQPDIRISEWIAGRFDCDCLYKLRVHFHDDKFKGQLILDVARRINPMDNHEWHKVSHTCRRNGPEVRYILFEHGGRDAQFWKGHYGSKITGGEVVVLVPERMLKKVSNSS